MNHPLQGDRPWPVEIPVEMPAESDPLIEAVERGETIHNDASPPVREINPPSEPWRRGGDVPRGD